MRFWPEALVFELEGMLLATSDPPEQVTRGARGFLESLDGKPWGVVTTMEHGDATQQLSDAEYPMPPVLLTAADLSDGAVFRDAAQALGAEPRETVAFTGTPAGVAGAAACAMHVVYPHVLSPSTIGASSTGWIVDLGQMASDIRGGRWAVTINS